MALVFLGNPHYEAFKDALKKANVADGNRSFQVALYVLTAVPSLRKNIDAIVNFQGKYLNPDGVNRLNLSMGERIMVGLALNLYNGFEMKGIPGNPCAQLSCIDNDLKKIYLSALEHRFLL